MLASIHTVCLCARVVKCGELCAEYYLFCTLLSFFAMVGSYTGIYLFLRAGITLKHTARTKRVSEAILERSYTKLCDRGYIC